MSGERPPWTVAVLALALVVKAVHLRDLPALVVAAQQRHVRRVPRLQQQQVGEHLQAVVAPVDEVAHEDVVRRRHLPRRLEQVQQVVVLPVDVAHDLDRRLELEQRRLVDKDVRGLVDQVRHVIGAQRDGRARFLCERAWQLMSWRFHEAASLIFMHSCLRWCVRAGRGSRVEHERAAPR